MAEDRRSSEGQQHGGGDRRFFAKPKFCQFCADKTLTIDYKKTDLLRKYVTEEGMIRPRRQTGACAKHQRVVAQAVKQARHIALLPYTGAQMDETR
jgi:small subunit ribosomal protein S18